MLKSNLCDYSHVYICLKRIIKITEVEADADARSAHERNNQATFKNFGPFTDCIREIDNTQVDNTKGLDS